MLYIGAAGVLVGHPFDTVKVGLTILSTEVNIARISQCHSLVIELIDYIILLVCTCIR